MQISTVMYSRLTLCRKDRPAAGPFLYLLIFLSLPFFALAQQPVFSPAPEDSTQLLTLMKKYQLQNKEEVDALPSRNKKDLEHVYLQRWKNIQETFNNREIYTDARAQAYLNQLVAAIRQHNPVLAGAGFSCYFSRSYIPNAEYIGEGIILFNMGLFKRLDNESEVAFVLCHEIAHYLLHHPENAMRAYVETLNSDEMQADLRRIKGTAYGKREQLEKLLKDFTFSNGRHSRDHESQADSMGVELMRNTKFAIPGALTALSILDSIDADKMDMASCLPKLFNAREYPFRARWIRRDEGLLGGHAVIKEEEMADSLKTHPDCKKRIALLAALMKGWSQPLAAAFVVDSAYFVSLKNSFRYENIEYAYRINQYAQSLFLTLELLQDNAGDVYGVTQVGKLFNGLYGAQKSHTLSKKTTLPAPGNPPNYNLLLQFIQNLYLEDLAGISYYYLKPFHNQMDAYPAFRRVYQESEQLVKN